MHIFTIDVFGIQIAPTWYGFMYALGFIICYQFMKKYWKYRENDIDNLLYFIFFGVILGGRLGYIFLYNLHYFIENPYDIFAFWKGGMSFHGGFIGVLIGILIFSFWKNYKFFEITDTLSIIIPIALGFGRIGNYINKELLGFSPYSGPFAVLQDGIPYFPSPILEMFLEGIVLFTILFSIWKYKKPQKIGFFSAIFLIGYGICRIIAEQFRLPDTHIGYLFSTDWITLGMIYTLPMLVIGCWILAKNRLS